MPAERRYHTLALWTIAFLVVAAGWIFARIYVYSTEAGDIFPPYSSLRADPLGAKALHDAVASLGHRVDRWFKPGGLFKDSRATVLLLNVPERVLRGAPGSEWDEWEERAQAGARLVIALQRPAESDKVVEALEEMQRRMRDRKGLKKDEDKQKGAGKKSARPRKPPLTERWKVQIKESQNRKLAWRFIPDEEAWKTVRSIESEPQVIERQIGEGSIVLIAESYRFSNEGLRKNRDTELLTLALGGRGHIVFDEYHLGTAQTGSVGGLLRRYKLTWAAGALIVLGLLFVWRNSSSLLPPASEPAGAAVEGRDSVAALGSLLRRGVPRSGLPAAALEMLHKSATVLRLSVSRRAQVERELELSTSEDPVALWKRLHHLTHKRT